MRPSKGLFVTGTDTGVGKTVVAAAITGALRRRGIDAGVMKPFQTGAIRTEGGWLALDAEFLKKAAGVDDAMEFICPVMLELPLAPSVAAERVGRRVTVEDILPAFDSLCRRHVIVIVEGAGGLAVPINDEETMRDLAVVLGLPVLIVARPGLGTINHTHLTVEYARAGGLRVAGVVLSNYPSSPSFAEQTNPAAIERLSAVPVLGLVQNDSEVDTDHGIAGKIVEDMQQNPLIERLMSALGL